MLCHFSLRKFVVCACSSESPSRFGCVRESRSTGGGRGHRSPSDVRRSRVPKHWLLDRDDARTLLVFSVLVLVVAAVLSLLATAIPAILRVVWVAVSLAQLIYAIVRVVRERGGRRGAGSR